MSARRSRANSSDNPDEDNARKKERLDCTIYKLKEKRGGFIEDDENKSNNSVSSASSKNSSKGDKLHKSVFTVKNSDTGETLTTFHEEDFRIISKTDILNLNYCMWENSSNVCWLDASMALLAHNQTLRYEYKLNSSTHVKKIIKYYNEAICLLNDNSKEWSLEQRLEIAKKLLIAVQESSLEYLQPILKYNNGDPESAFCSLFNLIREDKTARKFFEVKYAKSFLCEKCGKNRTTTINKPIITLPKIVAFQPSSPSFVSECPSCKDQEQRIQVSYKNLPKCLIFHFENGAGKGELCPLDFTVSGRDYKVTGLMTLEKSEETAMDHFVSWIRDPSLDLWLECNDLNPDVLKFATIPPNIINLDDVCMIMFESFDDLDIIEIKTDEMESTEKLNSEDEEADDENIPFIDLSQDNEDHGGRSNNTRETPRIYYGERNMSDWNEGDDLEFLNSICKSPSELDNDSQPDSFMKQLDLKPKAEESLNNFTMISENQAASDGDRLKEGAQKQEQDTLSTDMIENKEKIDNEMLLSDLNPTLLSMKQNILHSAENTLSDRNSPSVKKAKVLRKKKTKNTSKEQKESNSTVVKLVESENSQNGKKVNENSSAESIEDDFLMEQHNKLNQILASKKDTHDNIKLPSCGNTDKNKDPMEEIASSSNKLQNKETNSLANEEINNANYNKLNEKANDAKTSGLDEVINEPFSDAQDAIYEKPPFPIEVKTTIINAIVPNDQDSKSLVPESMPIFPVEENMQTHNLKSQKKDKTSQNVSKLTNPKNIKQKSEVEDDYKIGGNSPLDDFNLGENSYNEMALIVKKSEEITPENIIKVIRNVKPLSSSSSVSHIAMGRKRKRKTEEKDFSNLKIKSCSINIARLTPKDILLYSPGSVIENSSTTSSPDSTSTKHSSSSFKISNTVYNEDFNDILQPEPSNQKPLTNPVKKNGKLSGMVTASENKAQNSNDKSLSSTRNKRKNQKSATNLSDNGENVTGSEAELTADTIHNTLPVRKKGSRKKQITNSKMVLKTDPLSENIASFPSINDLTKHTSSPEKVKLEPTSASQTKKKCRQKKQPPTKKSAKTLSSSLQGNTENSSEAVITNQTVIKNEYPMTENKPTMPLALASSTSPLPGQKRKARSKKEANLIASSNQLQDQKDPNLLEKIDPPIRKSNRKRVNAFATLKDDYVLESTNFVQNQESMIKTIKQEKNVLRSNITSPDVKNIVHEDSSLEEEIPKLKNLRKRNYIISSASDSDMNTKSETSNGKSNPKSLKIKVATSSCTSDGETEPVNLGSIKKRQKRKKLSQIKSEDTLSKISEKLVKNEVEITEINTNVVTIASLSPLKEELVLSYTKDGMDNDKETNQPLVKKLKTEASLQMAKMSSNASKRGKKKSSDLISITSNTNNEWSKKIIKREIDSDFSPVRNSITPLEDGTNVTIDCKRRETTPKRGVITPRKKDLMQELTTSLNQTKNKAVQKETKSAEMPMRNSITPLQDETHVTIGCKRRETTPKRGVITPRKKDLMQELTTSLNQTKNKPMQKETKSAEIERTVDCLVDFYLSKTYSLFGIGFEEIRK